MVSVIIGYIVRLPHIAILLIKDVSSYIKHKKWKNFEGWGIHLYVGQFGAGKTCSMVERAYRLAVKFPQLTILTNLQLNNFPKHTKINMLLSPKDILNSDDNTLILIDEIGTIFNSRDFASSKESVPKIVFGHLCQCRKRHIMVLATTQCWNFLDKQLRDVTATVNVTKSHFKHPFTRVCTVYEYDAKDYDKAFSNPLLPLRQLSALVYVQSDKLRQRYDTAQLISNLLSMDYISDHEILENRGEVGSAVVGFGMDKKVSRTVKSTARKVS